MRRKKIKAIIFDLGGVIALGGYLDFLKHYCAKCFTPAGKKKILWLERQVNLGKISEKEFYKQIEKIFNIHLTPKQMHSIIVAHMQANKGLVHMISKIKKTKVVLFTNSLGTMALEVLKKRHLTGRKFFDRVFVSTKMHLAKPDRKAYQYVLRQLKVKPHETLMVDDRLSNIRPARKLGMNSIVFKNSRQFAKELKKYQLA